MNLELQEIEIESSLSKDSGIEGKSQRESREVCLNVKGSNYRFERSAGW